LVEVFSTDPDRNYCLPCFMTGSYFEKVLSSEDRSFMLERIRVMPHVLSARVFHAGEGAFQLAISLADGRMVTPGMAVQMNKQRLVVPFVPDADTGWGVIVQRPVEAENEWSELTIPFPDKYDDDELVELVAGFDVAVP
jgi:hypothetical protein